MRWTVSKQHVLLFKNGQKQNCSCNKLLDDEKLYPVIEAGATSYLLKTSRASDIADAVRATYDGETVLEPKVTENDVPYASKERATFA